MSSTRPEVIGRRRLGASSAPPPERLADDLLHGAQAIADYLGISVGQCYHWLSNGHIPCARVGDLYIGSRARLRKHFAGDASGEASQ
jgi:excisionase family DNA binding protein